MPDQGYPEAVLLFTTSQWRFLTGRVNAGTNTFQWLSEQVEVRLQGTWAQDFDAAKLILDQSQNFTFASRDNSVWADPTYRLPIHAVPEAQQTPGVLASPLLTASPVPFIPILPLGGAQQMQPVVTGLARLAQAIMKQVGSRVGQFGGWRAALSSALSVLGVTQIVDIVDQWVPGLGSDEQEKLAKILEAIAELEDAGIIYPWNPRARRDGTQAPGPFYLILDLVQMQGHYTNFHMSRKGLLRHDEKQDTPKRPRTAGRSKRNQN